MDELADTVRDGLRQEAADRILRALGSAPNEDLTADQDLAARVDRTVTALRRSYLVRWHLVDLVSQIDRPLEGGFRPEMGGVAAALADVRNWQQADLVLTRRRHARARAVERLLVRFDRDWLGSDSPGLPNPDPYRPDESPAGRGSDPLPGQQLRIESRGHRPS